MLSFTEILRFYVLKCLLGAEWFLSKMESFEILYSVALTWNVEKENIPKYIL